MRQRRLPTSDVGRQLDRAGATCGGRAGGVSLEVGSRMFRIGEAALLPLLHWRVIVKRQECRFPEKSARTKTRGECPCWALDVRLAGWPAGRLIARAAGTLL